MLVEQGIVVRPQFGLFAVEDPVPVLVHLHIEKLAPAFNQLVASFVVFSDGACPGRGQFVRFALFAQPSIARTQEVPQFVGVEVVIVVGLLVHV